MLLWVCFAILTAAVVALLLRPLREAPPDAVEPAAADIAVYRDQLRELDAERERGLFIESEIESARAEVARRILKRAGGQAPAAASNDAASLSRARTVYTAVAALLPVLGIGLYLADGSPQLPASPYAERKMADVGQSNVAELIGRVEERLREHPEDGKGWDVIAPVYLRLQRYADAAHAFAEANRLEGESVRRLLGFAEAAMLAENGIVTEPVRQAALRVLQLEPDRIEVQAWLALAKEQDGDLPGAAAQYKAILAKAPPDAPWRSAITDRLTLVEQKIGGGSESDKTVAVAPPAGPAPAPSTAPSAAPSGNAPDMTAPDASAPDISTPDISAMSPAEREAFISSMVDRLAQRLRDNGKDLDGWIRLARAYKVLGRERDAEGAVQSARETFAGDTASLAKIEQAAAGLGLAKEPVTPQ